MGVSYGNKSVKIFTKTKHVKINNTYNAKLYGVIEGPMCKECHHEHAKKAIAS